MTDVTSRPPRIETDGWQLVSAEEHQRKHPTLGLPELERRQSVKVGQAAKLLFDIETKEAGRTVDRGADRMWVLVRAHDAGVYLGILDSDPGQAENLRLRPGDTLRLGPEHIIAIEQPPRDYIIGK